MIGQLERILELKKLHSFAGARQNSKVIAVTSGKGGAGKTFFAINFARLLSENYNTLLVDLDFNLGNVAPQLNLNSEKTLSDFLLGVVPFGDLRRTFRKNFDVILGDSGLSDFPPVSNEMIDRIRLNIEKISADYDYIVLDTSSGIDNAVIKINNSAHLSVVITSAEPTAIMDSYAVIKLMLGSNPDKNIAVVVNKSFGPSEAAEAYENLSEAVKHFLNGSIRNAGFISFDSAVQKAILNQLILTETDSSALISSEFRSIADKIIKFTHVVNNNHSFKKTV